MSPNLRKCWMAIAACCCVSAQNPRLEFEVASVRVSEPVAASALTVNFCPTPTACPGGASRINGGPGTSDPERMTYRGVSMMALLLEVFGVLPDQISGPSWLLEPSVITPNRYDIQAEVPPGTTRDQANEMLRNLLVDRFHLVFHTVKKNFETYTLTVAKGGPKLTPAAPPDGPAPTREPGVRQAVDKDGFPIFAPGYPNMSAGSHLAARMVTTEDLVQRLRSFLDTRRVEDKTGLTGKYDFKLKFSPAGLPGLIGRGGTPADSASDPAQDLFTALEKQLGLKLEKANVPLDAVVIDRIERTPTEN